MLNALTPAQKKIASRVTARKYMGDCRASWAVFVGGQPRWTGLEKRQVAHYKEVEIKRLLGL